ncbi:adhesion G-protein coupled receptor F3 [Pagrus major]|uniref:adhesion G-protein coupled receptor F3 n=1 Tax=Pagrus major TaxID=143350 RepID=UPI003CC843E7
MWLFILLYILGLNISQAAGQDNSTQMYYVKLIIEESAIGNITDLLRPFVTDTRLHVDDLQKTTTCQSDSASTECTSTVQGFISVPTKYSDCLSENTTLSYKTCNNKLLTEMKTVYSTIRGFDSLTIINYRVGSIIATFEMTIAYHLKPQDLVDKSTELTKNLSGILTMETAGEYICFYRQTSETFTITHKASAVLDVCLLPNIEITTLPSFPHCKTSTDLLNLQVKCEIKMSSEKYDVRWTKQNIEAKLRDITRYSSEGVDVNSVSTVIKCDSPLKNYNVTCTFTNRCNQTRSSSANINIIYGDDKFCEAEGDWETTKAGFTAVLKCKDAAGIRRRLCREGDGIWNDEVSSCVNQDLNSVLEKALIADIGLGELDENAARVFSLLDAATNNSNTINTDANVNASVQVLFTLSEKKIQPNKTTAEVSITDFLDSSSNLLDKSLSKTWTNDHDTGNASMAERYLTSVERIIQMADIKDVPEKNNIEVAVRNCSQESKCTNEVFGVTVNLKDREPGSVKTAGFKELENYLPNDDDEFKPNSIVVSTTTERKPSDEVEIRLNFTLHKPRPPNVVIKCVSWDNSSRRWSDRGCEWIGEAQCVCSHLSSFAILMSRFPLDIPWINEVTYAALAISVVSLIISLAIELTVWVAVVKTSTLYLRHTAHVNISLCLLVADICFLASSKPKDISVLWCKTVVVLKHFCYLAMFFWMFCLSTTLLHQAVFPFHSVSKKNYMKFALVVGYVCPLLIVIITFLANKGGAEGYYYSKETCWLVYTGLMVGSIHAFVLPVGIIVFINIFSMLVVIMKLLDRTKVAEASRDKEKTAAITVMRSVIFLTPVFGVTWVFGFAVMLLDLTDGPIAFAINYIFTLLNGLQGLFILLTTCLGDKLTREALLNRLKTRAPASISESSTKSDSFTKK